LGEKNRLKEAVKLRDRFEKSRQHSDQVRRLAKSILKKLKKRGLFCEEKSLYLEAGALLHDIGQSVSARQHHRHSRDIILREGLAGFKKKELLTIACIAKFHRRELPRHSDADFRQLPARRQQTVKIATAILRIADGLDRSHGNIVQKVRIRRKKDILTFDLISQYSVLTEIWGALRKKEYFEDLTGLRCRFQAFEEN